MSATETATNTTAGNASAASNAPASAPSGAGPVGGAPGGIVNDALQGGVNGLEVAARFAGDIVRSVVPQSVIDSLPFLMADAAGVV